MLAPIRFVRCATAANVAGLHRAQADRNEACRSHFRIALRLSRMDKQRQRAVIAVAWLVWGCAREPLPTQDRTVAPPKRQSHATKMEYASNKPHRQELSVTQPTGMPQQPAAQHRLRAPDECRVGERRFCGGPEPRWMPCAQARDGRYFWNAEFCNTPLALQLDNAKVRFTRPAGAFAIGGAARTEWISADTLWLGRDLDGSGCLENQHELFGVAPGDTWPNGFAKLAMHDGNADGFIDEQDAVYIDLLAWRDVM
jgi:hypothetical protein